MNWAWLRFIGNILTNEAVMEPLIAAVIGYGISVYNKNRRYRIIMDLTADIVDYIEEHYKEWGLKGSAKMDKFIEIFNNEFKKHLGRKPKKEELETAMIRAEALVQRARRDSHTRK
ncbi:hypothetical protein [Thermosediminibacter oceani]|uniref:Phage protein n=1 Tax=Thermosediminibacter oceani (strain ATCC BAA-1034 / DSM 16646 / JW/IW-1228P) TaxID=555079 RepID=D9S0N9_THEOJ|nr:hypothetical protein [Thermosediminibacter oceani]ADL08897.1 hypothetical protein Toce_2185 [Thermosediminibacter oceani DSM 16646]